MNFIFSLISRVKMPAMMIVVFIGGYFYISSQSQKISSLGEKIASLSAENKKLTQDTISFANALSSVKKDADMKIKSLEAVAKHAEASQEKKKIIYKIIRNNNEKVDCPLPTFFVDAFNRL